MRTIILMTYLVLCHAQLVISQQVIEKRDRSNRLAQRLQVHQKDTLFTDYFDEQGMRYARVAKDTFEYFSFKPPYLCVRKEFRTGYKRIDWLLYASNYALWYEPFLKARYDYDSTGVLMNYFFWTGDSLFTKREYAKNGYLIKEARCLQSENNYFDYIKVEGTDSIRVKTDKNTLIQQQWHYQQQRLRRYDKYLFVRPEHSAQKSYFLQEQILADSTGKVYFHWMDKDTTALMPDKDNVKCLYGFRNAKEEWVIQPQYDDIKRFNNNYYIVNQLNKYGVLDKYGNVVMPLSWDFLELFNWQEDEWFDRDAQRYNITLSAIELRNQPPPLLRCKRGKLHGLVDIFGKTILEPVYQDIRDGKNDLYEVKMGNQWGIVQTSGAIVVPAAYTSLGFCKPKQFFLSMDTIPKIGYVSYKFGLVQAGGKVLLPIQYKKIESDSKDSTYFWVTPFSEQGEKIGLFHPEKGWIIEPNLINENYHINHFNTRFYPVGQNNVLKGKQYGLYDVHKHRLQLPMIYDKMDVNGVCCKDGLCGVWDVEKVQWTLPLQYDVLESLGFEKLLAGKNGKFQIIDYKGKPLLNETFDGGGTIYGHRQGTLREHAQAQVYHFLIRGDSVFFYNATYFPMQTDWRDLDFSDYVDKMIFKIENQYGGDDKDKKSWYLHKEKGLILAPPYKFVRLNEYDSKRILAQHPITKHQYLIDKQGNKYSFPAQYEIKDVSDALDYVLVRDTLTGRLGMMDKWAKTILPCQFFGMTLDSTGIIWARSDFDACKQAARFMNAQQNDFSPLDSNWRMYDGKGQQLNQTIFDYAPNWKGSLCIGQVKGKQGLWNRLGKNVLAAQYDKICFDPFSKMFHLFQGGRVYFADKLGQIVVKEGFINMSFFVNDTAFVETSKGYGMIRRDGNYVVTPQARSIQNALFPIIPQMLKQQIRRQEMQLEDELSAQHYKSGRLIYPASQYLFKMKDSAVQLKLGNFLMEQLMSGNWLTAQKIGFARHGNAHFYKTDAFNVPRNYNWNFAEIEYGYHGSREQHYNILDVALSANYLSYARVDTSNRLYLKCDNFKKQNNIWTSVDLNDIFIWDAATEEAIRQLLVQKISTLKFQDLDCSNPATLMESVKRQYYMLESGVQFFLPQTVRYSSKKLSASVLLSWAELKPFLK